RAGRYLNRPDRRLARPTEEADLVRSLKALTEALEGFPPLLGRPGRPGYRVIALARRPRSAQEFKGYDEEQREALARDWQAGHALLGAHGRFLRDEVRSLRRAGWLRQGGRAVWRTLTVDHPDLALLGLGILLLTLVLLVVWMWPGILF